MYAYISEWLADQMTGGLYPSVPHIVSLPDPDSDLRAKLGIPQHALVLGRHGGYNEFNLKFAQKAVVEAAGRRRDLYFIFLNTAQFCEHERVVFLPPVTDPVEKANFIQACDAMLHARARGETFGLAMAEFMFCGKPVLCWMGGTDRHHLRLLPDRTTAYKTYSDLLRILTGLEKTGPQASWQRMVARFSPVNVMNQFKSVFIDSPPQDLSVRPSLGTIFKTSLTQKALKVRYDLWREGIGL